jgi:hypothetical protein
MSAKLLEGKPVAAAVLEDVKRRVDALSSRSTKRSLPVRARTTCWRPFATSMTIPTSTGT